MTSKNCVHLGPDPVEFGVVAEGHVYNLALTLFNHGNSLIRIKISIVPIDGETNCLNCTYFGAPLAPGISTTLNLRLTAEFPHISRFAMTITYGQTISDKQEIERVVTAFVIPKSAFKSLTKYLNLNKRMVLPNYVTTVSRIGEVTIQLSSF